MYQRCGTVGSVRCRLKQRVFRPPDFTRDTRGVVQLPSMKASHPLPAGGQRAEVAAAERASSLSLQEAASRRGRQSAMSPQEAASRRGRPSSPWQRGSMQLGADDKAAGRRSEEGVKRPPSDESVTAAELLRSRRSRDRRRHSSSHDRATQVSPPLHRQSSAPRTGRRSSDQRPPRDHHRHHDRRPASRDRSRERLDRQSSRSQDLSPPGSLDDEELITAATQQLLTQEPQL